MRETTGKNNTLNHTNIFVARQSAQSTGAVHQGDGPSGGVRDGGVVGAASGQDQVHPVVQDGVQCEREQ